jgi:hypothetical protein
MRNKAQTVQAETEDGQMAGEAVVEVIENQIRNGDPPETKQTLDRLMGLGNSREESIRYIGCVFAVELFEVLKNGSHFNQARYINHLHALPDLPFDDEE